MEYFVKWRGYSVFESTWEPEANLTNCARTLALYQQRRGLRLTQRGSDVRFCSCVVQLLFMLYLCSVAVHSWLNWFALVIVDCSCNALQLISIYYEIEVYSGICPSICCIVVLYVELLWSRLA